MKVFITGATGYIGGSVAALLMKLGHEVVGLARSESKASELSKLGVQPLLGGLDDVEVLTHGARTTDATINAADAGHRGAAETLIAALAGSGKALIHTSGSSIVVDDAKGEYASDKIFPDDAPYVVMDHRRARYDIDCLVRVAGVLQGIRGSVICPTTVYGPGRGLQVDSDQVPKLIVKSKQQQAGVHIGKGKNIWSNVFIDDLSNLYALALEKAPSGSFFFAEDGENTLYEVAEGISYFLGYGGKTQTWDLNDATSELGAWPQIALGTNCRVRSTNARRLLGWEPKGPSLQEYLRGS